MAEAKLTATAYVVLGLVSVRPAAGHELTSFASRSVGNFFPLTRSHVYLELDRLCRLGLLDATEVIRERLPTKREYAITPAGTAELDRWLQEAEPVVDRSRNLFLVQIFFGDRLGSGRIAALLGRYEATAAANRSRFAAIVDQLVDRPESAFRRATAMLGVREAQARLDWVADVRPLLLAAAGERQAWARGAPATTPAADTPAAETPC